MILLFAFIGFWEHLKETVDFLLVITSQEEDITLAKERMIFEISGH